ncbi:Uncharacterised protein [Segatella copri]|nr:Uncharacterised protein [Segatella copri]
MDSHGGELLDVSPYHGKKNHRVNVLSIESYADMKEIATFGNFITCGNAFTISCICFC